VKTSLVKILLLLQLYAFFLGFRAGGYLLEQHCYLEFLVKASPLCFDSILSEELKYGLTQLY